MTSNIERASADYCEFQRLLEEYLRALRIAEFNDKSNAEVAEELAHKIIDARDAIYKWARP